MRSHRDIPKPISSTEHTPNISSDWEVRGEIGLAVNQVRSLKQAPKLKQESQQELPVASFLR